MATNLLLTNLYKEVFGKSVNGDFDDEYRSCFIKNIKTLVEDNRLSEAVLGYDLELLSSKLAPERDKKFKYLEYKLYMTDTSYTKKVENGNPTSILHACSYGALSSRRKQRR